MQQPRRFAAIRTWLDRQIYATGADSIPVLRWLMNTGAVYWFLLFCLLRVIAWGRRRCLAALLLPLLLFGTFLLGPVMQGRYLYPFICALPLFSACAFGALPDGEERL